MAEIPFNSSGHGVIYFKETTSTSQTNVSTGSFEKMLKIENCTMVNNTRQKEMVGADGTVYFLRGPSIFTGTINRIVADGQLLAMTCGKEDNTDPFTITEATYNSEFEMYMYLYDSASHYVKYTVKGLVFNSHTYNLNKGKHVYENVKFSASGLSATADSTQYSGTD